MTNWWWVRHGPTHHTGLVGWSDIPADLSDTAAIARLNAHLPQDAIVVSSDLIRCVATADMLNENRTRIQHDPQLREVHFGDWELKEFADVAQSHPELSKDYWTNPGAVAAPNGESWYDAAERVANAVARISNEFKGRDIIAVAHFGVILTQLQRATQMAPSSAIGFRIDNFSVTRIENLGEGSWRVLGVNHVL